MQEVSNPTSRVVDVLNFLAAHPTESFSLAEIARHLHLSNGSAHRILTTLARAHFLSRHPKQRTYSLGVAMVAIGQAAAEKHRGLEVARREMARLAGELNVQCSANTLVEDEILVLAKEGWGQSHHDVTRVGERRPLVPPNGLCHVAWSGDAAIASFIERAAPHVGSAICDHLLAAFPLIRERGYAMGANGDNAGPSRDATATAFPGPRDQDYWSSVFKRAGQLTIDEVQLLDLDRIGPEGVNHIAAPVFSPAGTVALQIVISGMSRDLSAEEIRRYAQKLRAVAASITSETHGRNPAALPAT